MIKVYIGTRIPELQHTEILFPNLGNAERPSPFGETIFSDFKQPIVEIVQNPESADYLCLPHNYNLVKNKLEYLEEYARLSETHSKKVLVFFPGDSDEEVVIPNAIVFRNSQYKHKKRDNEIIMPGFAVDLGSKYGLLERIKTTIPTVSFCGWANYSTPRQMLSHTFYNLMESIVGHPAKKKGLYFRKRALALLKKSTKVATNFIIRSSYSGSAKTLKMDPTQSRKEYIDSMKNSDFVLSPKGDGNFSVRFYEALSLGRIPVLIDTDCPLPLEDEINYDEFIVRIPHRELPLIADKIREYYDKLTPETYLQKQKRCREVFEKYLRMEMFFRQTMTKDFLL
jgi:glycosyltransferase involved in cell wall biosynthesis